MNNLRDQGTQNQRFTWLWYTESVFYVTKVHRVSVLRDQGTQSIFYVTKAHRVRNLLD